jgi:hypothetical protein
VHDCRAAAPQGVRTVGDVLPEHPMKEPIP